jgi:ferredoxin
MKITQEHKKCIGCGSCVAICPKYWETGDDGKSKPKGAKASSKGVFELEIKKIECNQEAADACPVQIIHVKP